MKILYTLILITSLFPAGAVKINSTQTPSKRDITGGAALIFNRPENPESRAREDTANKKRSVADDIRDKVDDAIALGNTARDRTPPDFESAERAYRLASKLDPRDPRPHLGLGNLYWDQRRYPEAARAYRDALRYMKPRVAQLVGILSDLRVGAGIGKVSHSSIDMETSIYLAATLLEQHQPMAAEMELRIARVDHTNNAQGNALLGYALSAQGRYTEAIASYKTAVKSEPTSEKYISLLNDTTQKALKASVNDEAIEARLQNTKWEVQDANSSTLKGKCVISDKAVVKCKSAGVSALFSNAKWRVTDGLVVMEEFRSLCIGQLRGETMEMKCYRRDSETNDVWTALQK